MLLNIPDATINRLALYRRCFVELHHIGVKRIKSKELSERLGIDHSTIRRDFSYLGELGRKGYGYKTTIVLEAFNELLKSEEIQQCVLIGIGNLGYAILNNLNTDKFINQLFKAPINLVAGFDINENLINQKIGNVTIHHLDTLTEYTKKNKITNVILAVPPTTAQNVVNLLDGLGIKGILNLSSTSIHVNSETIVHDVDLNMELETLFSYVLQKEQTQLIPL